MLLVKWGLDASVDKLTVERPDGGERRLKMTSSSLDEESPGYWNAKFMSYNLNTLYIPEISLPVGER